MNRLLAPSRLLDFLGRALMAAVFVNALPGKFTDFAGNAALLAAKGIPALLLVGAILALIAGTILLVFAGDTVLGASLLLVFLVPTTLIFHTAPVGPAFFMHLALIGGLILAITRPHAGGVPSFSGLRANKHFRHD